MEENNEDRYSQRGLATDSNLISNVNKPAFDLKKVKQNINIKQS
jgi:hypothetical protein